MKATERKARALAKSLGCTVSKIKSDARGCFDIEVFAPDGYVFPFGNYSNVTTGDNASAWADVIERLKTEPPIKED